MAIVAAIHAALLFALLNVTGTIELADPQRTLRVFDISEEPPPPVTEPIQQEQQQPERERPREEEGAASAPNIRSQATPIVDPKPRIALPLPVPMAVSETPNQGAQSTQGAADVRGPGTGAGGTGTGTGSGGAGSGSGGGGDGGVAYPPRLVTPELRGRDFPRGLLDIWPPRAPVFLRLRIDSSGYVSECQLDRGTGVRAIDSLMCNLARERLRFRPALNRQGRAVAGWVGYVQPPPR